MMARNTTKRTTAANRRTTGGPGIRPGGVPKRTNEARGETAPRVGHEQVAMRAYEIYLSRGAAAGRDLDDWLEAEHELGGRAGTVTGP
jgi:hypothetical protein